MSWIGEVKNRLKGSEELAEIKTSTIRDVLNGNIFAKDIVTRQLGLCALIVVLGVFYINNRYSSEKEKNQENILRAELKDLRYESLAISADLMKISRRSSVLKMIKNKGIDLNEATEPPIKIK